MTFVLGISGSRTFTNKNLLFQKIDEIHKKIQINLIVTGGARGADQIGMAYAKERGIQLLTLTPDWSKGKCAGILRNQDIIDKSHFVLCFWDGKSKGTKNTIDRCKKSRKSHQVILYCNYK